MAELVLSTELGPLCLIRSAAFVLPRLSASALLLVELRLVLLDVLLGLCGLFRLILIILIILIIFIFLILDILIIFNVLVKILIFEILIIFRLLNNLLLGGNSDLGRWLGLLLR